MSHIRRLIERLPGFRYRRAVEEGIRQTEERIEEKQIITELHSKQMYHFFYEKNHVTPLILSLVGERHAHH